MSNPLKVRIWSMFLFGFMFCSSLEHLLVSDLSLQRTLLLWLGLICSAVAAYVTSRSLLASVS